MLEKKLVGLCRIEYGSKDYLAALSSEVAEVARLSGEQSRQFIKDAKTLLVKLHEIAEESLICKIFVDLVLSLEQKLLKTFLVGFDIRHTCFLSGSISIATKNGWAPHNSDMMENLCYVTEECLMPMFA